MPLDNILTLFIDFFQKPFGNDHRIFQLEYFDFTEEHLRLMYQLLNFNFSIVIISAYELLTFSFPNLLFVNSFFPSFQSFFV